jgi:hypothetical protein
MVKKYSIGDFERKVFQITIADLANVSNPPVINETIEFKDTKIPFDLFKNCFFDNNYNYFELNNQFRNIEAITINNKIIKESIFFKNYVGGTKVNITDILILKYMQNKKARLDDISRISLIKDFNTYNSIVDFKVYNNYLSLDDVFTLFNMYKNKNSKKYFRFKIKVTYYSSVLDETISMYFNYIVKIPKNIDKYNNVKKSVCDNEFVCVENDDGDDDVSVTEDNSDKDVENIVYSNYNKNKDEKNNGDIKELVLYDESIDNISEIDDDAFESNVTYENSFKVNEHCDSFF